MAKLFPFRFENWVYNTWTLTINILVWPKFESLRIRNLLPVDYGVHSVIPQNWLFRSIRKQFKTPIGAEKGHNLMGQSNEIFDLQVFHH